MPKLTDLQIVEAVKKARGLVAVAARAAGIDRKTIYNRAEKSGVIREALDEAREFTTDTAEAALFAAIQRGEAWAVCFYLKTQGRGRGYSERLELTGGDGGPVLHSVTVSFVEPDGDDEA